MTRAVLMTMLAAATFWWGTPATPIASADARAVTATSPAGRSLSDRDGDDDTDDGDDDHSGSGSSGSGGGDEDPVPVTGVIPTGSHVIDILDDDGYTPSTFEIDAGQQVSFVNQHHDEHTATAAGFDTGVIAPGAVATITFDTPGRYPFACQFHEEMTGSIAVRDANGIVPEPSPVASAPPDAAAVDIIDLAFSPPTLTVAVGATVVWTDAGEASHTVTADDGSFGSDIIGPGTTFSHTFATPGTFSYACRIHAEMQAEIIVVASREASSAAPSPAASAAPGS